MADYKKFGFKNGELKRRHPSKESISPTLRRRFDQKYLPHLHSLLVQPKTAYEVVEHIQKSIGESTPETSIVDENYRFRQGDQSKPFFVVERDHNAFCYISPGVQDYRFEHGINIIVSHVDSPHLRLRSQPTRFEWDPIKKYSHAGPVLEVIMHGGIDTNDWADLNGYITGRIYTMGVEHRVKIPAKLSSASLHTADGKSRDLDSLLLQPGVDSVAELYRLFGIGSEKELFSAELQFYPNVEFFEYGDYISAYGFDDRACVGAVVSAILESKPIRPTFVFGLNNEEIGSPGLNSEIHGFFNSILREYLSFRLKEEKIVSFEDLYLRRILGNFPALDADVSPAITTGEVDLEHISLSENARFGFGPFVCHNYTGWDSNVVPSRLVSMLLDILDRKLKGKYQPIGSAFTSQATEDSPIGTLAKFFSDKGIPMIELGVPVGGLHRPNGEVMYRFDYLRLIQAYKVYINSSP